MCFALFCLLGVILIFDIAVEEASECHSNTYSKFGALYLSAWFKARVAKGGLLAKRIALCGGGSRCGFRV